MARDENGTAATLFAFAILSLLVGSGGAVDYGMAARKRTDLQPAEEAATLATGKRTSISFQRSIAMHDLTT